MKKFIIFLVTVMISLISCDAKSSYEYKAYGDGVELIIKTESHWLKEDTRTYGLRKDGIELIPPQYGVESVVLADELSLLIFMCEDRREIHVYSTTTGKEIFTVSYKEKGDCSFAGYRCEEKVVEGRKEWRIIEVTLKHMTTNDYVICIFCQKSGKVYRLTNPRIVYTETEI